MDTSSSSCSLGWKKPRHCSLPSLITFRKQWHLGQHLCPTAPQCHRSLWHFLQPQVRLALHSVHCLLWVSSHRTWGSSHAWEQLCWALLPAQVLPWICTNAVQIMELSLNTHSLQQVWEMGARRKENKPSERNGRQQVQAAGGQFLHVWKKKKKNNPKSKINPCWLLWAPETNHRNDNRANCIFGKKKKTNNTKRYNNSSPTGSDQGFTWASILCY